MSYQPPNTSDGSTPIYGITGSTVKLIAMACMLIDHFSAIFIESPLYQDSLRLSSTQEPLESYMASHAAAVTINSLLRSAGRIAFPLFAFLLVEGFLHTRSKVKYCRNLFLMALLSEIPFDLAFYGQWNPSSQNTLFTLTLGLLTIWAISEAEKLSHNRFLTTIYTLLISLTGCTAAWLMHSDYEMYGILAIVLFYLFRFRRTMESFLACSALTLLGLGEAFCFFSLIPIERYNGARGLSLKYAFYFFYPLHLLVLYFLTFLFRI